MPHNICSDNENCNLPVVNFGKLIWLRDRLNESNTWLYGHDFQIDAATYAYHLACHNTLVSIVNALSLPITLDLDTDRYIINL